MSFDSGSGILPQSFENLTKELSKLPGIGTKTALRLAFFILESPNLAESLAESMVKIHEDVGFCPECGFFSNKGEFCEICSDIRRDKRLICVVSKPQDVLAIEKSHSFGGIYHVLNGNIKPLDGIGPEDLRISELIDKVEQYTPEEVILATDTTVDGETTAHYLAEILSDKVKVTRIASGIPIGGELEYIDGITLGKAFSLRRKI